MTWHTLLGFIWRRDFLIPHDGIQKLIDDHLPYRNLQDAKLPVHIVTTDIVSGDSVVLSEGSAAQAIIASTAIPGAFAPVRYKDFYLADGAISTNTPIKVAVAKGARRLIILPTGYACATQHAAGRRGRQCAACADAADRAAIGERAGRSRTRASNISWCRLYVRWWDRPTIFREPSDHIERAIRSTEAWLAQNGLEKSGIPHEMRPHRALRPFEVRSRYVALQKGAYGEIVHATGRIDSPADRIR